MDPDETVERWQKLKSSASQVVMNHGGTISHQHGVGVDHATYLEAEKGKVGMQLIHTMLRTLDPEGILNPGKLAVNSGESPSGGENVDTGLAR
jgi:alkyldihydroxyacetonephosphate synthase